MDSVIINHFIEEEKILISFDFQDGSLHFPEIELDIKTDIDFNNLLIKLADLIEQNKSIEANFLDEIGLIESSPKVKLIKETLEEIYSTYNKQIKEENVDEQNNGLDAELLS